MAGTGPGGSRPEREDDPSVAGVREHLGTTDADLGEAEDGMSGEHGGNEPPEPREYGAG